MPANEPHLWVVVHNILTDEYKFMKLFEDWLPFKYCAKEDIQPAWEQKGLYTSVTEAQKAFAKFLTK